MFTPFGHHRTRLPRATALALSLVLAAGACGQTLTTRVFYDDTTGPNAGGNFEGPQFTYFSSATDPATGVAFDFEVTLTAAGGLLRTNGGTTDREFGVNTNNAAIDTVGESITAALTSLSVSDFAGNDPADVSVGFEGFTDVIAYFVANDGDSGAFTDGTNTLFEWNGSLDPSQAGGSPDASGAPFEFGVVGEAAATSNNARIDFSSVLPTTLVAESTQFSGSGVPSDPNRWRVDDFGLQFRVDVQERDRLTLLITPSQMQILGGSPENGADLAIDYVELRSESGSLSTASYTGVGGDPGYPAGSGVGDGWEFGSNNSANQLIESYLLGASTVGIGDVVALGDGFEEGGLQDIEFAYRVAGQSQPAEGLVRYVLPGDFNSDGTVDAADFPIWRDNLGGDAAVLSGNGDGSGVVDIGDYLAWRDHFGLSWGGAAAASAPEPSALSAVSLPAVVAFAACLRRARAAEGQDLVTGGLQSLAARGGKQEERE
ncbi:MAG: hypothetical protein AAGJ46_11670 [Planctomycetota bacterium]